MPTLLDWLISRYPSAKRQTLKRMLTSGRLSINGRRPRSLGAIVNETDQIVVADRSHERGPAPVMKLPFEIVYEDRDVLVIDKPPGLLTSTTDRERRPTVWAAVQKYIAATDPPARPGLIHRLDRDASGLLVFSKNQIAYRSLKQQFLHHSLSRIYIAHVRGHLSPPSGRLESHLVERADGIVGSTRRLGKGQLAITDYQTLSTTDAESVVRLTLQTGRKHQIRTQLAERGAPILNDAFYGEKECAGPLMLVATELAFDHPRSGKRLNFTANREVH